MFRSLASFILTRLRRAKVRQTDVSCIRAIEARVTMMTKFLMQERNFTTATMQNRGPLVHTVCNESGGDCEIGDLAPSHSVVYWDGTVSALLAVGPIGWALL